MGEVAEVAAAAAGGVEGCFVVGQAGDLDHNGAGEVKLPELVEEGGPVNFAFAGREMVVALAVVVAGVDHPEMAGEFVDDGAEVFAEVGVAGIEADAGFGGVEGAEDPKEIAGAAGE